MDFRWRSLWVESMVLITMKNSIYLGGCAKIKQLTTGLAAGSKRTGRRRPRARSVAWQRGGWLVCIVNTIWLVKQVR